MNVLSVVSNTPEWMAVRALHDTASEAPAAHGKSKYTSRSDLMKQKATGLTPEVDGAKQALFNRGHEAEAGARSLAEAILDSELYPVTATLTVDGIDLLASLDGATMDEEIIWEHKLFSEKLAADVRAGTLDPHYTLQLDQQLLVSGAKKCLFMTSDGTADKMAWCWYESSPEKFAALVAGWKQFRADLAGYIAPAVDAEVIGHTPETLPALRIEVTGMVTASNLADYKAHALAVFDGINRELKTDQQFADAEKVVRWCSDVEARLAAAKQHALSQTESIDALFRAIDDIGAEAKRTRLELDKLVKARKEAVRGEIVAGGIAALRQHIDGLNHRLGKNYMPVINADFGEAVKNKRTVASLQNAVDTELARAKIEAISIADRIQANLATLRELAADHAFLFADAGQIVLKATDDLTMLVKARIAEHQQKEAARIAAETARITAEVEQQARVKAEQAAAAQKVIDDAAAAALTATQAAMIDQVATGTGMTTITAVLDGLDDVPVMIVQRPLGAPPLTFGGLSVTQAQFDKTYPVKVVKPDDGEVMTLGQINTMIGPGLTMTADCMRSLGFEPLERDKKRPSAVLYREADLPRIGAALIQHLSNVFELQAA